MDMDRSMAGWVGFAGMVMVIVGGIDICRADRPADGQLLRGLRSGFLAVDLTTWGWGLLIWGALLVLAGLGLIRGQGWARWVAIVGVSVNVFAQLGFLGNSQYPLWALTALTLNVIVLYALTARWGESSADLRSSSYGRRLRTRTSASREGRSSVPSGRPRPPARPTRRPAHSRRGRR